MWGVALLLANRSRSPCSHSASVDLSGGGAPHYCRVAVGFSVKHEFSREVDLKSLLFTRLPLTLLQHGGGWVLLYSWLGGGVSSGSPYDVHWKAFIIAQ